MTLWEKAKVSPDDTMRATLKKLDESALQIALIVDSKNKLLGVVTDGDIRRAILRNDSLEKRVAEIMITQPVTIHCNMPRRGILAMMQEKNLQNVPVVDEDNRVVDIVSLQKLMYKKRQENKVVLMVGGLGTRLKPLTNECPKPLLKIGNKPILETILENFIEAGFYQFYFAVNYKSDMIKTYFGDGSQFGVQISYLHEKKRMGTAGALGLLPETMKLPVIVMNGDILTKVDFGKLLDYHEEKAAWATMAVREYNYQIPYGVINFKAGKIIDIKEKPEQSCFVNAGIYVLSPQAIDKVDGKNFFDMPDLFNAIIGEGNPTAAFPICEYWLDIGKFDDFEKAQNDFESIFK